MLKRVRFDADEEEDLQPTLMFEAYQFNERSTHVKVVCWNLTLTLFRDLIRKAFFVLFSRTSEQY